MRLSSCAILAALAHPGLRLRADLTAHIAGRVGSARGEPGAHARPVTGLSYGACVAVIARCARGSRRANRGLPHACEARLDLALGTAPVATGSVPVVALLARLDDPVPADRGDDRIRNRSRAPGQHCDVRIVTGLESRTRAWPLDNGISGIDAEAVQPIVAVVVGTPFSSKVGAGRSAVLSKRVADIRAVADGPHFWSQRQRIARSKEAIVQITKLKRHINGRTAAAAE